MSTIKERQRVLKAHMDASGYKNYARRIEINPAFKTTLDKRLYGKRYMPARTYWRVMDYIWRKARSVKGKLGNGQKQRN